MAGYFVRRLVETLLLLLVMSFLIYGLIGLMPGDPIDLMVSADPNLTAADALRLKALQGLDVPLPERYWRWLSATLSGDLGYSRLYARPVLEVLGPRLLNTLLLMGTSLILALVIAVPAGIVAALDPRGPVDNTINLLAFAGFSMPSFWLGLLLIILFSVQLGWLPAGGSASIGESGLLDRLRYLILPVLTLTLLTAGTFIRFVRAAMLEALREDFIRTARVKGLSTTAVVIRHALPHTALAMITMTALHAGSLFSGALVVETIFAYLGMGKLIYDAILGNDYNLALVALLLATLVTLVANLVADLAYGWLDPRIDYGG
ncbi:MAG: ABC transporter permease [Geminicoccaceae bacterium]|jgi:peptide/nickel transport system permease protein|nr:ABC transporter permease [Geminicoccaceae bacterium]